MHDHHSPERLMAQLDGARLVKYDADGYVLAWFGGHGVTSMTESVQKSSTGQQVTSRRTMLSCQKSRSRCADSSLALTTSTARA